MYKGASGTTFCGRLLHRLRPYATPLVMVTPCYSNSVLDDAVARVLPFGGGIRRVFCACGNMLGGASSFKRILG